MTDIHETFLRQWTSVRPQVAAYVRTLVRHHQYVDDILQEVALALWRRHGEYDPKRPFIAWAIGVARLESLVARRAAGRSIIAFHTDLVESVTAQAISDSSDEEERTEALKRCLEAVTDRIRQLLHLRYQEDLQPRTIAERLGESVNTVRVALHRARISLEGCIHRRLAGRTHHDG